MFCLTGKQTHKRRIKNQGGNEKEKEKRRQQIEEGEDGKDVGMRVNDKEARKEQ